MKIYLATAVIIVLAFSSVTMSVAQGPAPPPAQNEVPLDGFDVLLLVLGAGYVGFSMRKRLALKTNPQ